MHNLEAIAIHLVLVTRPVKLHFSHTILDRVRPDGVPKRRIPCLCGRRSQSDAQGLKFWTEESQWFIPAWARHQKLQLDLLAGRTTQGTSHITYNPRHHWKRGWQGLGPPVHLTACSAFRSNHQFVLNETTCRSLFQKLLDRPDVTPMDWAAFQACLEESLLGNPAVNYEDKCVEKLTSSIQEATAVSSPNNRPPAYLRPPSTH
jgi:hypothetical protein